jgi:hypothetical protein
MLPIAIYGLVTKGVPQAMFRLARLFHWVCSKNVHFRDLDFMKINFGKVTLVEISQNVTTPSATISNL